MMQCLIRTDFFTAVSEKLSAGAGRLIIAAAACAAILAGWGTAFGAEPWQEFYAALLDRGYTDTAVEYVESLRDRPNMPEELRSEIDYLIGRAILAQVKSATPAERDVYLKQSKEYLNRFLEQNPSHPNVYEANAQLARIAIREGERELAQITDNMSDMEKMKYLEPARKTFESARAALEKARELGKARVKSFLSDKEKIHSDEANIVYGEYLELRLDSARLIKQIAETYPANSAQWRSGLDEAQKAFENLYEKYGRFPGGFQARYEEARIAVLLGQEDKAEEYLDEIALLPTQPALYVLKTQAFAEFGRLALADKKPKHLMQMIRNYNTWKNVEPLPPSFYISSEGLTIHLQTGEAALALLELRENDKKTFNQTGKELFSEDNDSTLKLIAHLDTVAYEALDFVYRQKSPLSLEAEKLLQSPVFGDKALQINAGTPADFNEAQQRLNRIWTDFIQINLDKANALSPEASAVVADRLKKTQQDFERNLRWAFRLAHYPVEPKAVDALRLQWTTMKMLAEQYEETEIIADFLMYHRPQFDGATKAAEMGLNALSAMYRKSRLDGTNPEQTVELEQKIVAKTDYIIKRWGENLSGNMLPIVQKAVMARMDAAIGSGNSEKVREFLAQIPEDSPLRSVADIQLGQSIWSGCCERLADKENPVNQTQMEADLQAAWESLERGLTKRLEQTNGGVSTDMTLVYAALSAAQIAMRQNRPADALTWLSHPNIGPMNIAEKQARRLAREDDPEEGSDEETDSEEEEAVSDSFQISALTLALRVEVALNDFEQAEKVMTQLETFVAKGQGSQQRLTNVYLQLGKQLEEQIGTLRNEAAANPEAAAKLDEISKGFESFLERISERQAGNTYFTLRWVGDTFFALGTGMTSGENISESDQKKAQDYFTKAGRTYHNILKRITANPEWAPSETANVVVTSRLVECLGKVGRYEQAVGFMKPLLETNENNLDLQFAAASLYEGWGSFDKAYFVRAIQGGEPKENGKNLIWGWNRIVTILSRNLDKSEIYKQKFYDAVLHKMECRKRWLMTLANPADKAKQANGGVNELVRLEKVQPDLGGPAIRHQLEAYKEFFQQEAGSPPAEQK